MKILIIGSKGFIGTHLVNGLSSEDGYTVYGCDVVVDYESKDYILIDATNADYHSVFQNNIFDICINCSGAASVPDSLVNPLRDYTLNTYNVFKILDAIRLFQSDCKFMNLSSAAVYGNPNALPVNEVSPLRPISPYGLHKLEAESICKEFYQFFKVQTCCLRIFSAYGIGLRKQLLWDLYQKAKGTNLVSLFGTGKETRDFIHISDIVDAVKVCIKHSTFDGQCINIANGKQISIEYIASKYLSFFDEQKTVRFSGEIKNGDPLIWQADISLLSDMGYLQKIDIIDGLYEYFKWVKSL